VDMVQSNIVGASFIPPYETLAKRLGSARFAAAQTNENPRTLPVAKQQPNHLGAAAVCG
jgi:hypothetical protein